MDKILITFDYDGQEYSGHFSQVSGGGSHTKFFLMINKFYRGQLVHTDHYGWQFTSNDGMFQTLSEYFGNYITARYQ